MAECSLCFRHCNIKEGEYGFCAGRTCKDGKVIPENYGMITSIALDPIEKKPLNRFFPGSRILSVGSYGCNLRCPFCQNHQISWGDELDISRNRAKYVSPEELVQIAEEQKCNGNIGVAFTYNEPLISYEYILDTANILKDLALKTVVVTNGMVDTNAVQEMFQYVDAMNIDLKGFTNRYYQELLKGNLEMVKNFISEAVKHCHVELTTLVIPGENDFDEEIEELSQWISLLDEEIPLHLSRFFPRFQMSDRSATPVETVYHLKTIAEKYLKYVYTGNC
ncbi:AmmeMemoRadiSam system radical SAM enzyme [Pseudobutyrivibrio xylanivorans]|uniref:Pyruvate formate lyase activating enzyme n=1 Tax=Pseudobutyrivibrio xylanivorans DSM 14809 TaxID=1123012 RepID=A0A1M6KKA4_PSEXY|nr:AmmeMemoRadiSam system radical SAM enzyme [Pseudobutyrivibrio xylanivorans]SHJ59417.1 pyruvate formate lyase activating enzyme [Pseudobutyrivibrio xylanivorans DSM 14809]